MSIRLKMLLPMLLLAVASIAAVLITVSVIFSGYVDDTIGEEVDIAGNILEKEAADLVDNAHIVAGEIAESETVAEALLAGDGEAVLAAAETYLAEAGMDVLTVTDAEGVVVASAQDPAAVGSAANQADIASALGGAAFAGFEEGGTVALAALAAEPLYGAEGQIIGAVSVGRDLGDDAFVDDTKALVQAEVTIFHRDTRLATTVIKADGGRAVGTQASDAVVEQVLGRAQPYTGTAAILERDAFVEYTPLKSNAGEVVGMLFTGKYTDVKSDALGQFIGFSLLVVAILLALAVPVCLYISGRIVKPIKVMVAAARQIALGDVNVQLDIDTKDETRQLADAFGDMTRSFAAQAEALNAMAQNNYDVEMRVASDKDVVGVAINRILDNNNRLLADIGKNAKQVSTVSSQISDGSQNLAQATTEQSATVEELLASMNDIAEKTRENAKRAEHAANLAGSIKHNAEQGTAQMGRMTQAVEEINAASQSISAVIKVIDDIAFQTNILALNAAVEAARAGEHGKGFAVVADEVRNLAGKSAEAAKDTGKLIADTVEKAELGARIASETSQSLDTIVEGINESTTVVGEIAASSDQQNLAIEEVNKGIDQVSQVVQTNSATAEESAAAAEEMSSQAAMLQGMVAQFNLKGRPSNAALPPAAESRNSAPSLPAASGPDTGYIL